MLEKFEFRTDMVKTAVTYAVIIFVIGFGITVFKLQQATFAKPGNPDNIKLIENAGNVMPVIAKGILDTQTNGVAKLGAKLIKEKQQD